MAWVLLAVTAVLAVAGSPYWLRRVPGWRTAGGRRFAVE
jgi:hypothetical protein